MKFRFWICVFVTLSAVLPNQLAFAKGGSSGGSKGSSSSSSSKGSSGSSSGKSVHVNSYTRKDGTVVHAYDRSAPGSGGARITARTSAPGLRTTARGLDDDEDDSTDTVYVSNTGSKYHRKGCRYLKSSNPISLADAINRYSPCSACHPPTQVPSSNSESTPAQADNRIQKPAERDFSEDSALAAERLARQKAEAEAAALRKQIEESKVDPEKEEKLAQSRFELANELRTHGNDTAANRRFQELLKDHPNTTAAVAAAKILGVKPPLQPGDLRGKVVSIADGDTVTVLDSSNTQHKIRLQGIDAPEKAQAFGTKSKENLSEKIFGKQVLVKWKEKDKYGRLLGEIYLGDRHINLEMVQDGMAWHYKKYSKDGELAAAEESARKEKRGLWADNEPVPPWDFRKAETATKS